MKDEMSEMAGKNHIGTANGCDCDICETRKPTPTSAYSSLVRHQPLYWPHDWGLGTALRDAKPEIVLAGTTVRVLLQVVQGDRNRFFVETIEDDRRLIGWVDSAFVGAFQKGEGK